MNLFNLFFFICFSVCVVGLILHSFFTFYLRRIVKTNIETKQADSPYPQGKDELFYHVIQLPVFNEDPEMVKGLIDSACRLDYPQERLIIQLLDDSDSKQISSVIKNHIQHLQDKSPELQLLYLHRPDRTDYKAGNLNYGLEKLEQYLTKRNEWEPERIIISIFDADYQIPSDYCKRIENHFSPPDVGIVQTYTNFRNSDVNDLTRAQTIFGDNLHLDEFSTRARAGQLSMFRGSAGSLRLLTILESGCWQGDTQIEDVDLSFLAQCNGWKVLYDDTISSSSLLPEKYNGYKLQQRSWMKGLMEVMRKRFFQIMTSKHLRFSQKVIGLDFFLILCLQATFIIIAHLTLIPAYYFWCSFGSSTVLNTVFLGVLVLLFLTHIPFFVRETDSELQIIKQNLQPKNLTVRTTFFAFGLMTAMFVTLFYGCVEGLLKAAVHRDRTSKGSGQNSMEGALSIPLSSMNILKRINGLEFFMAAYSIFFIAWAFYAQELILGFVFSTLALIYPLNFYVSFQALKKTSDGNSR